MREATAKEAAKRSVKKWVEKATDKNEEEKHNHRDANKKEEGTWLLRDYQGRRQDGQEKEEKGDGHEDQLPGNLFSACNSLRNCSSIFKLCLLSLFFNIVFEILLVK